ncbi:MAG: thiol reductase thioredoxin [Phenylobacterium zucineum]|nr:MAG: thiol reductase thioredoxin [Phenylobacterium zucineum]
MVRLAAAALVALALTAPAVAAPAPKLRITDYAQLKTPLPYPYDEKADASAAVDRAFAKAKASGKLLLVDMGGNWCGDCRILAATMEQTELKGFLARHYEVVAVDVGRMDKNLQVPARWGVKDKLEGVPAILIVDPKTNRQLVSRSQVAALADARHMKPQDLADWLAQWTK